MAESKTSSLRRSRATDSNIDLLIEKLELCHCLSIDTETTGLNPYHGDTAFVIVMASEVEEFYFDLRELSTDSTFWLCQFLNRADMSWFFVNAKFDLAILRTLGVELQGDLIDAPSMARIEYNLHPSYMSMDYLAEYYLARRKNDQVAEYIKQNDLYKTDVFGNRAPDYAAVPSSIMFDYACDDARITYDLCTTILESIARRDSVDYLRQRSNGVCLLSDIVDQEIALTRSLASMERDGLRVDLHYVKDAFHHELSVANESEALIKKQYGKDFNPNSPELISSTATC